MTQSPRELATALTDSPHIRFVLHPVEYTKHRLQDRKRIKELVETSTVSLRGWDFPYIDRENERLEDESIISWNSHFGVREYWQAWKSLQFLHLYDIREVTEKHPAGGSWQHYMKNNPDIPGHLDFVNTIWNIYERFEFASRFVGGSGYNGEWVISLKHESIGQYLLSSEARRPIWHVHVCGTNSAGWKRSLDASELVSEYRVLACDCAIDLFERFGFELPSESISAIQDELIAKR